MVRSTACLLLLLTATAAGAVHGPRSHRAPRTATPRPLPFFYDLYAFRGDSGSTDVVASFAVEAGELDREEVDGEVRYRFNVTLVLVDTARGDWSRTDDSVYVSLPRPLAPDHLLHTHVETRARPSMNAVQRVLMIDAPNPGTGQQYLRGYRVPDFSGDELMVSDIALGLPGRSQGWMRGGSTLALLPSSHFPSGLFDVYYEIYNLDRGTPYATEISFRPVRDPGAGRDPAEDEVRVRFTGEAATGEDATLSELRRLEAALDPGPWRMTVTVTDGVTGRTAQRTRVLEVREWREGATLVPACPVTPGVESPRCRSTPTRRARPRSAPVALGAAGG